MEYYVEYKFDGLTINLTYDKGILISASTRGNGVYGEEVFEQVKTIKSIPLEIDYKLSLIHICTKLEDGIQKCQSLSLQKEMESIS